MRRIHLLSFLIFCSGGALGAEPPSNRPQKAPEAQPSASIVTEKEWQELHSRLADLKAKHGPDSTEFIEHSLDLVTYHITAGNLPEAEKVYAELFPKASAILSAAGAAADTEKRFLLLRSSIHRAQSCLFEAQKKPEEFLRAIEQRLAVNNKINDPLMRVVNIDVLAEAVGGCWKLDLSSQIGTWIKRLMEAVEDPNTEMQLRNVLLVTDAAHIANQLQNDKAAKILASKAWDVSCQHDPEGKLDSSIAPPRPFKKMALLVCGVDSSPCT